MQLTASNIPVSLDAILPDGGHILCAELAHALGCKKAQISNVCIAKKSIDARKKSNVHAVVTCAFDLDAPNAQTLDEARIIGVLRPQKGVNVAPFKAPAKFEIPSVAAHFDNAHAPRPVVVGTGPAGLFAALTLARAGARPLCVERGQSVDDRAKTVEAFNNGAPLNTSSNIQFGEGGAGTFSDGKLNTGTKSPHIRHVLETFVAAGAPPDILVDAKPHIGTDYLASVVKNIRQEIERLGGQVLFNTQLVALDLQNAQNAQNAEGSEGSVGVNSRLSAVPEAKRSGAAENKAGIWYAEGVTGDNAAAAAPVHVTSVQLEDIATHNRWQVQTNCVVLACGHSARDTFEMLAAAGFEMQRKPFAVGVRIEHPQAQINAVQYGSAAAHPALGAADYKLAHHNKDGRGVYTFCMCPGGQVVAAASEQGGVCVNGMSNHARNGQNANSALLVEVRPEDLPGQNVLEGVAFQRKLERAAFELGGKTYKAPAQTVGSFMRAQGAATARANKTGARTLQVTPTYPRGVVTADLRKCLPPMVTNALAEALPALDKKLPGFADPAAIMTAVEARSSSPVRIVRNKQTLESVTAAGVYPCGEGAGYAGGIMSAAVDGIRVAEAIINKISSAPHEVSPGESGSQAPVAQPAAHPQVTPSPTFEQAAAMLRAGVPLIFPTDTVFGLGMAATATTSPQALFCLKNRPQNKPVAWLIAKAQDLQKYGEGVPEYAFKLAKQHWPGALTLIVKASGAVPAQFASAQRTIGLRVPAHAALRRLIEAAGAPLATTSANVSGHAPASSASEIPQELAAQVAIYTFADQPECAQPTNVTSAQNAAHTAPSTVIDCTGPAPKIIRP